MPGDCSMGSVNPSWEFGYWLSVSVEAPGLVFPPFFPPVGIFYESPRVPQPFNGQFLFPPFFSVPLLSRRGSSTLLVGILFFPHRLESARPMLFFSFTSPVFFFPSELARRHFMLQHRAYRCRLRLQAVRHMRNIFSFTPPFLFATSPSRGPVTIPESSLLFLRTSLADCLVEPPTF